MKALIDGDIIVYQGGFASDQTSYQVGMAEYQYKKDANQYADSIGFDRTKIVKTVTAEPVEYCLSSIKKMMDGIVEATDAQEKLVLLTGPSNFRDKLYSEYKANRDTAAKPIHYNDIRSYLIKYHKADVVTGVEADDALGWHQMKAYNKHGEDQLASESCICTVDKDLNMIPGWHYNWRKDIMYWVTMEQANYWFFHQWLTGDAADNIPGIKGIGEKTATKILADVPKNVFDLYHEVISQWFGKSKQDLEFVHMVGDLLWMQRCPGGTWDTDLGLTDERDKA